MKKWRRNKVEDIFFCYNEKNAGGGGETEETHEYQPQIFMRILLFQADLQTCIPEYSVSYKECEHP
jgi:hypothetical protein